MTSKQLPKDGHTYRIWSVVEDLIVERYDELADERMRDSYYLLREWLDPLRQDGTIQDAEFDYFVEHYEYYRDDFWPRIEERHGFERPATKPPTTVIEAGTEYTESHIEKAWDRSRGFVFVEKSGMAEDLSLLSEHGWLIVAAQGESTRSFREKLADDGTDRPVLVLTDADFYGGGITESLRGNSERTAHLDLEADLRHRVSELGLTQADADALDLPRERDPTQSPDEWRTELNALTVLKERMGVAQPLLAYTIAKMKALTMPICPLPVEDPEQTVRNSLRRGVEGALQDAISDVVDDVMAETDPDDLTSKGDGKPMQLRMKPSDDDDAVDLDDLQDELVDVAEARRDRLLWWHRTRYEEHVVEEAGAYAVKLITDAVDGAGGGAADA
jgi:5S rRNA maturation endonuclease (ribonuclease M5)